MVVSKAVDCKFRTAFIECHVRAIVPSQRSILFHYAPVVASPGDKQLSNKAAFDGNCTRTGAGNDPSTSRKVRLVKMTTVLPMTQVTARVAARAAGLCLLQNHPRTAMYHLTLIARAVMDVIPRQPFTMCVSSPGDKSVHLPRHTTLGIALASSANITTVGPASLGVPGVKEKGENENEGSPNAKSVKTWKEKVRVGLDDEIVWREV